FGPVDPDRALGATVGSLTHSGVVLALGLGLTIVAPRHPRWAGTVALLVTALDLGLTSAPLVWTVPQADLDTPSRAAREIAAAERARPSPSPGPFRVHRMGASYPEGFAHRGSPQRLREAVAWERDTLHPLYALPLNLDYTLVQGILESDDYAL